MSTTLKGVFSSEVKSINLFTSNKKKSVIYKNAYSAHGKLFRVEDKNIQNELIGSLTQGKSVNPFRRYHMSNGSSKVRP
jgi:hypothetical protein